jgi:hypothetical protein
MYVVLMLSSLIILRIILIRWYVRRKPTALATSSGEEMSGLFADLGPCFGRSACSASVMQCSIISIISFSSIFVFVTPWRISRANAVIPSISRFVSKVSVYFFRSAVFSCVSILGVIFSREGSAGTSPFMSWPRACNRSTSMTMALCCEFRIFRMHTPVLVMHCCVMPCDTYTASGQVRLSLFFSELIYVVNSVFGCLILRVCSSPPSLSSFVSSVEYECALSYSILKSPPIMIFVPASWSFFTISVSSWKNFCVGSSGLFALLRSAWILLHAPPFLLYNGQYTVIMARSFDFCALFFPCRSTPVNQPYSLSSSYVCIIFAFSLGSMPMIVPPGVPAFRPFCLLLTHLASFHISLVWRAILPVSLDV